MLSYGSVKFTTLFYCFFLYFREFAKKVAITSLLKYNKFTTNH